MPERLVANYPRPQGRYDEMLDARGAPRPHWRAFLSHLAALPADTLRDKARFVRDAIVADGVTYNAHTDPAGASRTWELDLLPVLLQAKEWAQIASAVEQRARLLDGLLGDLYGPQRLLAEGLLPPALIFGQRGYLWPCRGIVPPEGRWLHLYAVDLARAPDGSFWILADRTRGPAGAGYALENRLTLARAFPDAFRELPVTPLAGFYGALQDNIARLARVRGESPLVVLLTPGPYNETYFEHAFLARQLGFPLVEGQDLLVRGDAVYLKTLRGLRRVHAILRRLDDDFCDPVELRADSALGVPGLLHAVRAGNVLLANALGSGVLETNAIAAFLPKICERLLGEKLAMPSIATWWCGEGPALAYAEEHLSHLVIKPTYPTIRRAPVFGHSLEPRARAELLGRMRAQPHAYVAQEWVHLSHAPTWGRAGEGLCSRAVSLRVFAVATRDGYAVLPGALSRVAASDGDVVSLQWGGSSKDTWVLAEGGASPALAKKPLLGARDVATSGVDIPSRVGENLFWIGRYAERCEGIARLLRAALVRVADASPREASALRSIAVVCETLGILDMPSPPSHGPLTPPDFIAAVADPEIPGGLAANVLRLHASAGHVRERMSTDNWHVFNRLPRRLPGAEPTLGAALDALDDVMLSCVSLLGFAVDDMTRDESWRFLLLGRRLERLGHLTGVIGTVLRFAPEVRVECLEWLLETSNSIVTFRARYRRAPELLPVLHLVVLDGSNPHAVAFQLAELRRELAESSAELGTSLPGEALEKLAEAVRAVDLGEFEAESGPTLEQACAKLAGLLERLRAASFGLSDELQRRFFSHASTPLPLGVGT
jgi:uncharacterized circularly permuted ATP-grasp superfamily protein/uncharacterized alpha-E superfamily protein